MFLHRSWYLFFRLLLPLLVELKKNFEIDSAKRFILYVMGLLTYIVHYACV